MGKLSAILLALIASCFAGTIILPNFSNEQFVDFLQIVTRGFLAAFVVLVVIVMIWALLNQFLRGKNG